MLKAYKFRLYPTEEQKQFFTQCIGNARFVYNHCLGIRKDLWKNEQKTISMKELSKHITDLKKYQEYEWLKKSDSIALHSHFVTLIQLFNAFSRKKLNIQNFIINTRKILIEQSIRMEQ